jgi:hypothetical protein
VLLVAGITLLRSGFDPGPGHGGFVMDNMALGQAPLEYLGFPCQFSFHQILHTHLPSATGTTGEIVADIPNGLTLTPPHEIKISHIFKNCDVIHGGTRRRNWLRHYATSRKVAGSDEAS